MPNTKSAVYESLRPSEILAIWFGRILFLSFLLLPFLEMSFVSLKSLAEAKTIPYRLLPTEFYWSNYLKIWQTVPHLGRYMGNSLFLGLSVTLLNLVLGIPAAYGFSRLILNTEKLHKLYCCLFP